MSEMWQRDYETDGGPDGGSDHGSAGADEDPASGTGGTRTKRNTCKATGTGKNEADMSVCGLTEICYELSEEIKLDKNIKHNIEIVVDRLIVKPGIEKRLTDSVENVLSSGRRTCWWWM